MSACAVTNFNNGLEASSDSDDEDKLHIVEEESQEAGGKRKSHKKTSAKPVSARNGDCNGVKEECVSEGDDGDEDDGDEEAEEGEKDALVEKILEQGDTAIIYPEAPEEERGAAETGGADENGTPDALPLHICPYCSRGYKRNASLKEHIKYRHETSEDNYSCSHCSYTFTYRSQLERHMSHHRGGKVEPRSNPTKPQRHSSSSGGARKFKCIECSKAFKYKHHLKEHLRIHSGEKPYECSNCQKRFSHSGSYSSHISSKKCAPAHFPNGLHHPPLKPHQIAANAAHVAIAPARNMDSKPLQEHIPLTQIKTEPVEEDVKPVLVNGVNRTGVSGLPPGVAMVVPTVGLMSPIGININDLQNVLGKVLANGGGTQGKQGFVVQQPQQQIISLPAFVDHDGTTKIIINYSISPTAATTANTQPAPLVVKSSPPTAAAVPIFAAAPIPSKTEQSCVSDVQEFPTDLSILKRVKEEPVSDDDLGIVISKTESVAEMPKTAGCLLCEDCPEHLEAVHLLQHRKAANCEAVDSAALDPSFADLLSEAGVTLDEPNPTDDVLSVLRKSFASNARPTMAELEKVSKKVSIPADIVRKWFMKMNKNRKKVVKYNPEQVQDLSLKGNTIEIEDETQDEEKQTVTSKEDSTTPESPNKDDVVLHEPNDDGEPLEKSTKEDNNAVKETAKESDDLTVAQRENEDDKVLDKSAKDASQKDSEPLSTSPTPSSAEKDLQMTIKTEPEDPSAPESEAQPLDLSLPKPAASEPTETPKEAAEETPQENGKTPTVQVLHNLSKLETTPLNLACISKDQLEPRALYVTTPQSGNSNFVTATQIPTLVAIAGQGTVGCLSAINPATKQRTILIPQLTYTYGSAAGSNATGKTVLLNGHKAIKLEKKEKMVSGQKSAPPGGGQGSDADSKKLKLDPGVFPCDLCCKVFQKASSLLRHKYEHTGKRPHECIVCKKAFKHKHHLIEHARLHTGIKPYECDKCGKRFSHSGSYSQHMNHRYSYCKPNPFSSSSSICASSSSSASSPPAETLDHRYYAAPSPSTAKARAQSNGVGGIGVGANTSEDDDEEEDDEEEYEEEAMCMEDIRVVQVDEFDGCDDDEEESGEEMEVELGEGSDEEWVESGRGKDWDANGRRGAKHTK